MYNCTHLRAAFKTASEAAARCLVLTNDQLEPIVVGSGQSLIVRGVLNAQGRMPRLGMLSVRRGAGLVDVYGVAIEVSGLDASMYFKKGINLAAVNVSGGRVALTCCAIMGPAVPQNASNPATLQWTGERTPAAATGAVFGPLDWHAIVSTSIVLAQPTNGCPMPTNKIRTTESTPMATLEPFKRYAGMVVLVERGSCSYQDKVKNAQDQGAVSVVVYNDVAGSVEVMSGAPYDETIHIPSVYTELAHGLALRTAIANKTTSVTITPSESRCTLIGLNLIFTHSVVSPVQPLPNRLSFIFGWPRLHDNACVLLVPWHGLQLQVRCHSAHGLSCLVTVLM